MSIFFFFLSCGKDLKRERYIVVYVGIVRFNKLHAKEKCILVPLVLYDADVGFGFDRDANSDSAYSSHSFANL